MARWALFIIVGWVVTLPLVCETVAQGQNASSEHRPRYVGSQLAARDSWLISGMNTVFQHAGGRLLPMRTSAGVRFVLYTRQRKERIVVSRLAVEASGFDSSNPTAVLVHGYYNKVVGQSPWLEQVAEALLDRGPWNVIVVDWSRLCSVFYAPTVVRARRIPGPVTADLLRMLQDVKGLNLSTVHVVGFSLGAHVAGFVGQNIQGIGRITGLDPAGPQFRTVEPSKRLSPDDALFVDVVNTNVGSFLDGLSLGINPNVDVGHVSVIFNGGIHQPGCWVGSSCSHYRAPAYFIESLRLADDFLVYPCEGSTMTLPVPFGLHMPHTARGCYFAAANRNEPYLHTPSPLPLHPPTTEASDIFEDGNSSNNRRVYDQHRHLEQDSLGRVSLLDFPGSKPFLEQELDQESEQVSESSQLLNPEQFLEPDHLLEPKLLELLASQTPAFFNEPLRSMRQEEPHGLMPTVTPTKSIKLQSSLQPLPKQEQIPQILRPRKPQLQAAEGQTVYPTPKSITIFDVLLPWSKRKSQKPLEDNEAALAYEEMLAQF